MNCNRFLSNEDAKRCFFCANKWKIHNDNYLGCGKISCKREVYDWNLIPLITYIIVFVVYLLVGLVFVCAECDCLLCVVSYYFFSIIFAHWIIYHILFPDSILCCPFFKFQTLIIAIWMFIVKCYDICSLEHFLSAC